MLSPVMLSTVLLHFPPLYRQKNYGNKNPPSEARINTATWRQVTVVKQVVQYYECLIVRNSSKNVRNICKAPVGVMSQLVPMALVFVKSVRW